MQNNRQKIVVVGAGINGLVAANYLQRGGCEVTIIERKGHVGGACISETANVDGVKQAYALGPSVLGLMQEFIFRETGLVDRLRTFVSSHPHLMFFPGDQEGTSGYSDPIQLKKELAKKWGEEGDVEKFHEDQDCVVAFLQKGYCEAKTPTIVDAIAVLGEDMTKLWISGSARALLDYYFTSDKIKIYMMMLITETGPISVDEPYTAFSMAMIESGSVFDGIYGFVEVGIWRITEELGQLNKEIGIVTHLSGKVEEVDTDQKIIRYTAEGNEHSINYDQLVLATDPKTAGRLVGSPSDIERIDQLRIRGSAGKLNLMFKNPVRWKYGEETAFRYLFSVDTIEAFEDATMKILDENVAYAPSFLQVYCEGAAMRKMNYE
ncbi:MAG: NAD(P)/FAD-dependent oxidoreductase, partial [Bacteroidetes bacterium]|nr:NAD(P)/FAD-dependent oxidoreductase [Bacteroidota bacterium]